MQRHGHGDAQRVDHGLDHGGDGFEACHIFARAFGHAENDGAVHFLRSLQRGLRPLQIVDVELAYGVVAVAGFLQHFGSVYQHNSLPSKKSFLFWAGAPSADRSHSERGQALVTNLTKDSITHRGGKINLHRCFYK